MALRLFEGYGVELEYMIVDRSTLDVRPLSDRLLERAAGALVSDLEFDRTAWSNELVLHVIEFKTNGPAAQLRGLERAFQEDVGRANRLLAGLDARLMPGAMHPWMDPYREMRLWPHDYNPVYESLHRIFDCRGHGWANLQSVHLNLPFGDDREFGRLHAAIRLVLPILPALAASSPLLDGRLGPHRDNRLAAYRGNARRVPSICGRVIPEPLYSRADYQRLLAGLYRDIAPYDPQGLLQHEWLNARGAIARFDRDAIEIRLLDIQECPLADCAVLAAVSGAVRAQVEERWLSGAAQQAWPVEPLAAILDACVTAAEDAPLTDAAYLAAFGYPGTSCRAGDLWRHLAEQGVAAAAASPAARAALDLVLEHGSLASRLIRALGANPARERLAAVYRELCDCLAAGRLFVPHG